MYKYLIDTDTDIYIDIVTAPFRCYSTCVLVDALIAFSASPMTDVLFTHQTGCLGCLGGEAVGHQTSDIAVMGLIPGRGGRNQVT